MFQNRWLMSCFTNGRSHRIFEGAHAARISMAHVICGVHLFFLFIYTIAGGGRALFPSLLNSSLKVKSCSSVVGFFRFMTLRAPVCFPDIRIRFPAQIACLSDTLPYNLDAPAEAPNLLLLSSFSGATRRRCFNAQHAGC